MLGATPVVHKARPVLRCARRWLRWVPVCAIAALALVGCDLISEVTGPSGKEIVIFVDFSTSIRGDNKELFRRDLEKLILPSLEPGDRILIAPINDKTFTSFHPMLEATFPEKPSFNGWMDNKIKHARKVKEVEGEVKELHARIREELKDVFKTRATSRQTDIFSSLVMAQKVFENEPRQRVLVLMSDMIVDYPPYHFNRIRWNQERRNAILSDLSAKGLIPDLTNVCVYVSGVSAPSAEVAGHIAQFWKDYFRRANADMDNSRYAHVLLHWPPSKSCRV